VISYQLAQQLKDAGFPQNRSLQYFDDDAELQIRGYSKDTTLPSDRVDCPTLSELIEACEHFRTLERIDGRWWADAWDIETRRKIADAKGATPDEAVARLRLALIRTES
jgi:hypothetical protein